MPDEFPDDIFLSHTAKDKAVVRPLAERSHKAEGRRQKDEIGLHPSYFILHTLLESGTFRFRDPLNKERRFLPLLLSGQTVLTKLAGRNNDWHLILMASS